MKKLLLLVLFSYCSFLLAQDTPPLVPPKIDERIEILSICFRLAGAKEYSGNRYPEYIERINAHFAPFKDHELIRYIKSKVRKRGVGYDAVMFMAISLTNPPELQALVPFSEDIPESRWGEKRATKFLELLKEFYVDADCAAFFKANQELYQYAAKAFYQVYKELDVEWYSNFYGEAPKGEFRIVNGLGNGGGNYGPSIVVDGKEIIYAIMGTWRMDEKGKPKYEIKDYFPTFLHEFNHSFVNHLVEKYQSALRSSGNKIYPKLKDRMRAQAYGQWSTMYAEAIVRAAVVKYLEDHNYEASFIQNEVDEQINRGFIWTRELVDVMHSYDQQRTKYPSLESYMPQIVSFFDQTAESLDQKMEILKEKRPKVLGIKPFKNKSQSVDPEINQIEVLFDRPLRGKGYSINYGKKGKKTFPKFGDITYSKDKKSVYIQLKLKANKSYQFLLTGASFKTAEGFGIEDFEVSFKTAKK